MSSKPAKRRDLMAALDAAMREASGLSVLYSHAVAARLGINGTDIECLDYIAANGKVTAGALAERTGLTTGAITGVIDRLEEAGLACRERDPEDRRKVLVRALPAARDRVLPLFTPMQRAAAAALSDFGDDELALLLRFFTRAREAAIAAAKELRELPEPRKRR